MWEDQKGEKWMTEEGRTKDRDQRRREERELEKEKGQKRMEEEGIKGEKGVQCPFWNSHKGFFPLDPIFERFQHQSYVLKVGKQAFIKEVLSWHLPKL